MLVSVHVAFDPHELAAHASLGIQEAS
jgi:hypothetical protein